MTMMVDDLAARTERLMMRFGLGVNGEGPRSSVHGDTFEVAQSGIAEMIIADPSALSASAEVQPPSITALASTPVFSPALIIIGATRAAAAESSADDSEAIIMPKASMALVALMASATKSRRRRSYQCGNS